jgi:MinD-like ATPase involved in chromosome partitioning or flagellar assembly
MAQVGNTFANVNQKIIAMNTNITLSNISSMFSSEESYMTLVDMINEMDLELMDISLS